MPCILSRSLVRSDRILLPLLPPLAMLITNFNHLMQKNKAKSGQFLFFFAIFARCFIVNNDVLNFAIRWIA